MEYSPRVLGMVNRDLYRWRTCLHFSRLMLHIDAAMKIKHTTVIYKFSGLEAVTVT